MSLSLSSSLPSRWRREERGGRTEAACAPRSKSVRPPLPPPAEAFALAPHHLDNNPIDNGTRDGLKAFNKAVEGLPTKFDGESKSIVVLQSKVTKNATNNGWNNSQSNADIINIADNNVAVKNLITEYGQLMKEVFEQWYLN